MLVVSRKRYIPVMVNTLVLSGKGWYFYVHRDVYDQALLLANEYDNVDAMLGALGKEVRQPNHEGVIRWFFDNAPRPIHILSPLLALVEGPVRKNMAEICGVLHVITAMIHVRNFLQRPEEIRKSVTFSLAIKEEYEMSWDRFFQTAIPYDGWTEAGGYRNDGEATAAELQVELLPAPDMLKTVSLVGKKREAEEQPDREVKKDAASAATAEAERKAIRKLLES